MCASICICMCGDMCEGQRTTLTFVLQILSALFLGDRVFHWSGNCQVNGIDCHLTLNHPPALVYPVLGLEGCTSIDSLLYMGFGPLFQVLLLKIVYRLSFLSRPLNHI